MYPLLNTSFLRGPTSSKINTFCLKFVARISERISLFPRRKNVKSQLFQQNFLGTRPAATSCWSEVKVAHHYKKPIQLLWSRRLKSNYLPLRGFATQMTFKSTANLSKKSHCMKLFFNWFIAPTSLREVCYWKHITVFRTTRLSLFCTFIPFQKKS